MLNSTSEIVAKTKLLTETLDSTKKQMGEEMEVLQKSYTQLEEKSNQVESIKQILFQFVTEDGISTSLCEPITVEIFSVDS